MLSWFRKKNQAYHGDRPHDGPSDGDTKAKTFHDSSSQLMWPDRIAANTITAAKIQAGTITADKIASNAVTTYHFSDIMR